MRRVASLSFGVVLLLAAAAPTSAAGSPALVKDINPYGASNPTDLTVVGSTLFFAANDGVHGTELWKSDGTAAGTKMVKNIRPYGKSSDPENLVNVNGTLFFTAIDGVHGRELWKSDGTKAGTVMVKDLNTGKKNSYGGNGTYLHEGGAFAVGSRLFFIVDLCCIGTSALYVSDGTGVGTVRLDDDEPISVADDFNSGAAGGRFYFVVVDKSGEDYMSQLWMSDGTTAGTRRVPGSPEWYALTILPNNGSKLYFYTDRLWRTDGTAAGTFPISDIGAAAGYVAPMHSVLMNQRLYFGDVGLWKTDGTYAGTKPISNGEVVWLTRVGSRLFFTRGTHLWRSDGTAAGTQDVGAFGSGYPRYLVAVGDDLCFSKFNLESDTWALWTSDGTVNGTHKVRAFSYGPDYRAEQAAVAGTLFFAADDGVHGTELWSYTP